MATTVLAGCGGGDADENVVDVRGDEYAFVVPTSIEGGWTTLRLQNTGKEAHEFALAKLAGDRTRADVLEVLSDPETQEQGPPDWVSIRAGIPTLEAGETASLTQRLEPGRYALICFLDGPSGKPHFLDGMVSLIDVGDDAGAGSPEADATADARKGSAGAGARGRRADARADERRRTSRTPSSSSPTSRARPTRTSSRGKKAG